MHTTGSACPLAHQGIASPCCAGQPLSRPLRCHDAGAKHPVTPRAARLASSSLAQCYVGTVHWPAHVLRMAKASTLHVQLTTPTLAYGQNSHPSHALRGTHCCYPSASCECMPPCRSATAPSCPIPHTRVPPPMLPYLSSDCTGIKGPLPLAYRPPSTIHWSTGEPPSPPLFCFHSSHRGDSFSPPLPPFPQVPELRTAPELLRDLPKSLILRR
jgi:hypothetical protein